MSTFASGLRMNTIRCSPQSSARTAIRLAPPPCAFPCVSRTSRQNAAQLTSRQTTAHRQNGCAQQSTGSSQSSPSTQTCPASRPRSQPPLLNMSFLWNREYRWSALGGWSPASTALGALWKWGHLQNAGDEQCVPVLSGRYPNRTSSNFLPCMCTWEWISRVYRLSCWRSHQ